MNQVDPEVIFGNSWYLCRLDGEEVFCKTVSFSYAPNDVLTVVILPYRRVSMPVADFIRPVTDEEYDMLQAQEFVVECT